MPFVFEEGDGPVVSSPGPEAPRRCRRARSAVAPPCRPAPDCSHRGRRRHRHRRRIIIIVVVVIIVAGPIAVIVVIVVTGQDERERRLSGLADSGGGVLPGIGRGRAWRSRLAGRWRRSEPSWRRVRQGSSSWCWPLCVDWACLEAPPEGCLTAGQFLLQPGVRVVGAGTFSGRESWRLRKKKRPLAIKRTSDQELRCAPPRRRVGRRQRPQ